MGWTLLGIFILGGLGYISFLLIMANLRSPARDQYSFSTAVITMLPAPTLTPVLNLVTTSQPGATASASGTSTSVGGIVVGSYVKISGTNGEGLNIRSDPGTNSNAIFLGMDAEVFMVKKGPQTADGLTWWYLQAPYDTSRSGWAAAKYLVVVKSP